MYMIEMHYKHRASTQIILEKGDAGKTYDEFSKYRLILNHSGDVDERYCQWCQKTNKMKGGKI